MWVTTTTQTPLTLMAHTAIVGEFNDSKSSHFAKGTQITIKFWIVKIFQRNWKNLRQFFPQLSRPTTTSRLVLKQFNSYAIIFPPLMRVQFTTIE